MIKEYLNLGSLFLSRSPTYLVFHITSFCNARCKMCFNWKKMNLKRKKEELSLGEIDKFTKNFGNIVYVSLGGGEPSLRKDLSKIVQIFYKNNNSRIFQIATNGLLSKVIAKQCEEILKKCPEAILKITLSLDGIGKDHDYIRGVKGNFKKVLQTYKLLYNLRKKYRNLEILVNTVYSKYSENKAITIYNWVKSNMDVDMHGFTYVRGETRDPKARKVSLENYEKLIKYIEEDYHKRKFKSKNPFKKIFPVLSMLTRRGVLNELKAKSIGKKRTFKCPAGRKMIHIDPFGNIFPCEYLPTKKFGNLRDYDYSIKKILNLKKTKEVLKFIKNKKCNCTWECAIKDSIVHNCRIWPTILIESLKLK